MELANRIKEFIQANKSDGGPCDSQNKFAAAIDVNPAYISGFLKEGSKYRYAKEVIEPARNFLDNFIEKVDINQGRLPFIKTKDASNMFALVDLAIRERKLSAILGDAGTGKTRTMEEFSIKHPDVVLVETTKGTNAKILLEIIADEIGVEIGRNLDRSIRLLAKALKDKQKSAIILDEAENLPHNAIEAARRIYDFNKNIALILVGTYELENNLKYNKSGKNTKQQSSRVKRTYRCKGLTFIDDDKNEIDADLRTVCDTFGVKDERQISLIKSLVRGNMRQTEYLLESARDLARYNNIAISEPVIEEAAKTLFLDKNKTQL